MKHSLIYHDANICWCDLIWVWGKIRKDYICQPNNTKCPLLKNKSYLNAVLHCSSLLVMETLLHNEIKLFILSTFELSQPFCYISLAWSAMRPASLHMTWSADTTVCYYRRSMYSAVVPLPTSTCPVQSVPSGWGSTFVVASTQRMQMRPVETLSSSPSGLLALAWPAVETRGQCLTRWTTGGHRNFSAVALRSTLAYGHRHRRAGHEGGHRRKRWFLTGLCHSHPLLWGSRQLGDARRCGKSWWDGWSLPQLVPSWTVLLLSAAWLLSPRLKSHGQ